MSPDPILGPGGASAKKLGAYEARPEQLAMAAAVAEAIAKKKSLLVEAGTGVGKSFAYLVPAIEAALADPDNRVVVSTHTISLQEQLLTKDLPFLQTVMPKPFRAALVKGRGNYLSLRRLQQALNKGATLLGEPRELQELGDLRRWAGRTRDGTRSDLAFKPSPAVWEAVQSDSGNCLGKKCKTYNDCFFYKARKQLQGAHILVVNHALFFTDLALRGLGPNSGILPKYRTVIFDEAHTVEDVAADHLGLSISRGQCDWLLRKLLHERRGAMHGLLASAGDEGTELAFRKTELAVDDFFVTVAQWRALRLKSKFGGSDMLRVRERRHAVPNRLTPGAWPELARELARIARADGVDGRADRTVRSGHANRCVALGESVQSWLGRKLPDQAYWVEGSPTQPRKMTLASAPIEVGPILREQLFDKTPTVILTKPRLWRSAAAQGGFMIISASGSAFPGQRGSALQLGGSPFDFATQVDLHLFTGNIAQIRRSRSSSAGGHCQGARITSTRTGGRAFVLFHEQLQAMQRAGAGTSSAATSPARRHRASPARSRRRPRARSSSREVPFREEGGPLRRRHVLDKASTSPATLSGNVIIPEAPVRPA